MTSRRLLDPAAKLLLDAADYMENHGFGKFHLCNQRGEVCVRGAIYAANQRQIFTGSFWACIVEVPEVAEADRRLAKVVGMEPHLWNNRQETTKEDAVRALRQAAIDA